MIVGGAQENTLSSVSGLVKKGHDVLLVSGPSHGPEGSLESASRQSGAKFIIVSPLIRAIHPLLDAAAFCRLVAILRKEQVDIVHTHSAKAGVLGRLAARVASPSAIVVHTVHGLPFIPGQSRLARNVFLLAEKIAFWATDQLLSVGKVAAENAAEAGIGRIEDYIIVHSGFPVEPYVNNPNRQKIRRELGITDSEMVVGMIARFFPLKGQEFLLRAFAVAATKNPAMKLLLIGDGIQRAFCEKLAISLGIQDKTIFTGLLHPDLIPNIVSGLDVGAHTSLREGLPRAIAQIMAGGKPVVAFDADGAREVITEGKTGFLVTPTDEKTLSLRLLWFASHPEERMAMGALAQERVLRLFSLQTMVDSLETIYFSLLARNGYVAHS